MTLPKDQLGAESSSYQVPIIGTWKLKPVLPARFFRKVQFDKSGCWIWTGSRWGHPKYRKHAYGQIRVGEKRISAHVFSYLTVKGEIRPGFEIDHCCNNKLCVNPQHLEAVTHLENIYRRQERRSK